MSYYYQFGDGAVLTTKLPNGHDFAVRVAYTGKEAAGVIVSTLSLHHGLLLNHPDPV
jgi:hypothetical protein